MKKLLSILFFVLISGQLISQNQLLISNQSVIPEQVFYIQIEVNNSDAFVALQLDLAIPDAFTLVDQSVELNSARIDGHTVTSSVLENGDLRILCYSTSNTPFIGNSAWVVRFQLEAGKIPGNYQFSPQNVLIGDSQSANILSGTTAGTIQIVAPEINIIPTELNFGETAVSQQSSRSFTIQNNGTQTLSITNITIPDNQFVSNKQLPFNIEAGQSTAVNITFTPTWKGSFDFDIHIISNDPDEPELEVAVLAQAYTINEIYAGSMFAFSGDESELLIAINNMEAFTAVQFDLALPTPLQYIDASVEFVGRNSNHGISAQQLDNNRLRVVAFSADNSAFTGTSGDLIKVRFQVNGTGGYYSIPVENGMIGHADGTNILSAQYGGSLQVAAADISCSTNLSFGEVSSLESKTLNLQINNYGSDELIIDRMEFSDASFSTTAIVPMNIPISQNNNISVQYKNSVEGTHSGSLSIFSNDPNESPFIIQLSGETFIPNYISIPDKTYNETQDIWVEVWVENYEEFVAMQFDLNYPSAVFNCLTEETELSERLSDHQLQITENPEGTLRVIIYSLSQTAAIGQNGSIVRLKFTQDQPTEGVFDFTLANTILGNTASENIIEGNQNGQITIIELPDASLALNATDIDQVSFMANWQAPSAGFVPTNYYLEVATDEEFTSKLSGYEHLDVGLVLTKTVTGLDPLTTYFYRLQSYNIGGDGAYSNTISLSTLPNPPNAPLALDATSIDQVSFTANWQAPSSGFIPTGYYLEVATNEDFSALVSGFEHLDVGLLLTKSITGLDPLTNYFYRVQAYNTGGDGAFSNSISLTTLSNPGILILNPTNISYGNVPITETRSSVIQLKNVGEATLKISEIVFETEDITFDVTLPLEIHKGDSVDITMNFVPLNSGDFSETIIIKHNGLNGQNLLNVEVTVFSPNFLKIESQDAYLNEENTFQVFLKNNDAVRAVQFDLELPNGFELDLTNVATTLITSEYLLSASELSLNNYRIIMYSQTNTALNKGDQAIIEIPVFINSGLILGEYQFIFRNVIISDENNKDISSIALENGTITLINRILEFNKTMSSGWNWFSVYLLEADMGLDNILSSLNPQDGDYIKDRKGTGNSAQFYNIPGTFTGWTGTLSELDPKETYKIKLANDGNLTYQGSSIDYETEQIPVLAGWNWVGYPIPFEIPVSEYLTTLDLVDGDYLKDQINSTTYYDAINDWFGQLETMIPGDGYVLNVSNAGSIYEPITEFKASYTTTKEGIEIIPKYDLKVNDFEFSGSATIEVFVDGSNAGSETNILYAFNQDDVCVGIIRGLMSPISSKYIYNLMMYSNTKEGDKLYFKFFDRVINKWFSFEETINFKEDMIIANAYHPFELRNAIADEFIEESNDIIVYPNPFMENLNYSFVLDANKNVKISIVNAIGVVVEVLEDRTFSAGQHLLEWNNVSLAQGYYYLRIEMDGFEKTIQILKMN